MIVYNRLKFLLSSLSEVEKKQINKSFTNEEPKYKKLFTAVQEKTYEEIIPEGKRKKDEIKSFNNDTDYLEKIILSYFSKNPTSEHAKNILALNEIIFLLDHGIEDIAITKTVKLSKTIGSTEQAWMIVYLLHRFHDRPEIFNNLQYIQLLAHYCSRFAAFDYSKNSNPHWDFLNFIEEYRKESSNINLKIYSINQEILPLVNLGDNSVFTRKMKLILEKANLIISKYSFIGQSNPIDKLLVETENEILQASEESSNKNSQFTMTAFYADSILSTENLIYKINNIPAKDYQTQFLMDEDLIDDIIHRMEINRIIMKIFAYNVLKDPDKAIGERIMGDIQKLLKNLEADSEATVFLKTLFLMFAEKNKIDAKSTKYKYTIEIKEYPVKYYIECLNTKKLTEPSESSNLFKKILYNYRLRFE